MDAQTPHGALRDREADGAGASPAATPLTFASRLRAAAGSMRAAGMALVVGKKGAAATTATAAGVAATGAGSVASGSGTVTALSAKAALVGPAMAKFLSLAPPTCFFFMQTAPYVTLPLRGPSIAPRTHAPVRFVDACSRLKTMREIVKNGSTGQLNPLPFVSLAANCVVWTLYGILQNDMTVLAPNASGLCFGLLYTAIYVKYNAGVYVARHLRAARPTLAHGNAPILLRRIGMTSSRTSLAAWRWLAACSRPLRSCRQPRRRQSSASQAAPLRCSSWPAR